MKAVSLKRLVGIAMFAALATVVTLALMMGPFGYTSVCNRCGALRSTTEWQLPMTSLTVFRSSTESESPLSRVLLTNGIVAAHSHQWLFAQGGGNGVKCAIGK